VREIRLADDCTPAQPRKRSYDKSTWDYEIVPDGYVKADPALAHPRWRVPAMKTPNAATPPKWWIASAARRR